MLIREKLKEKLRILGTPGSWEHITRQLGVHSFIGLNCKYSINRCWQIQDKSSWPLTDETSNALWLLFSFLHQRMSKLWNSFMINSVGVSDKSVALGRHWVSLGHSLFLRPNYHGGWAHQCWSDQKLEFCTDHWFNPWIQGLMIIWNFWFWAVWFEKKNQLLHICNIPSKLSDWFEKRHHAVCNFSL